MEKIRLFYKNKKVFVTGHTGFKGSWLVSTLLSFGSRVYGYSIKDHNLKNYDQFCNKKKIFNTFGNILDYRKLKLAIKKAQPQNLISFSKATAISF